MRLPPPFTERALTHPGTVTDVPAAAAHRRQETGRRETSRARALPAAERRAAIVTVTLPLLATSGEMVTTRQIAEAAGVAEGTIFRVFADKDEVIAAAVDAALDPAPLEAALAAIDASAPFEERLVAATEVFQRRIVDVWRVLSNVGARFHERPHGPPPDSRGLTALFESAPERLAVEPVTAARLLRALTMSTTHPLLAAEPMTPAEIVELLLHGIAGEEGPPC